MTIAINLGKPDYSSAGSNPYLGEIVLFAGNYAPRGWAFCDGQLLSINSYSALFSILGTTYGGDGRTTFALPDLRGRAPIHEGTGSGLTNRRLGERSGQETVSSVASHTHNVKGYGGEGNSASPENSYMAKSADGRLDYAASTSVTPNVNLGTNSISSTGNISVNNMQPYLVINYIIAIDGEFPPRN